MKGVFYLLVLANLGLASWQLSHRFAAPRAEPNPVPAPDGARELARLAELSPRERRDRLRSNSVELAEPAVEESPRRPESPPRPAALAAHPGARCSTFGPLPSEARLQPLRAWLSSQGARISPGRDERREVTLYWVYLPPHSSRAGAEERILQLRSDGIEDIHLIARGNMANAISLGMYRRRDSLQRRFENLRAKGYDPVVAPRLRAERGIWLDVLWPAGMEIPERQLRRRFSSIAYTHVPCAGLRIAGDPAIAYNPGAPRSQRR